MMHLRGSFGSPIGVPEPSPKDAFHRLRDSSFWSGDQMVLLARGRDSWKDVSGHGELPVPKMRLLPSC